MSLILLVLTFISINIYSVSKPLKGEPFIDYYNGVSGKLAYRFVEKEKHETILFYYGFSGNIIMMTRLISKLQDKYNVLVVEYPGHGYSPANTGFDISNFNLSVNNILKEKDISDIYIIGYSLGGIVALDYYSKYEQSVKKIVLLHSVANFKPSKKRELYFDNISKILKLNFLFTINEIAIPLLKDKYFSKNLLKISKRVTSYNDKDSVINYLDIITGSNYDYVASLINCPALVIGSKIDFLVPEKESLRTAKLINNCECQILENMGHLSIVSRPLFMSQIITDFIESE